MVLWQIGTKLSGKLLKDERSPFCDAPTDVRPKGEVDGDNSEALRKVEHPDAPSG